jgi:uroporphyrinogen III methyltransferase/synthase
MGIGNLDSIAKRLIDKGRDADTPAAVIANATFPTQRVVRASLGRIREECSRQKVEPPALVVIGAVADSDDQLNWFMKQPLFGKNIVVTRDAVGNADFAGKIIRRGGNPLQFATIRIMPQTDSNEFLQSLAKFSQYDWIIFTSGNGVSVFFDALEGLGKDARVFGSAKIAAIGSKTAAKLSQFGIEADFVPDVFTGRELGRQLIGVANLQKKKILLLRSAIASESSRLVEGIREGTIDWLTFASPSSVDGFFGQIDSDLANSAKVKIASIGPVTSERLGELGITVDVTAAEHTIDGLLNAIEQKEFHNGFS